MALIVPLRVGFQGITVSKKTMNTIAFRFGLTCKYYKLSKQLHRLSTATIHCNPMVQDSRDKWLKTAQSFVRDPIHLPLGVDNTIIDMVDKATNGTNVLHIMDKHNQDINDASVYNKAMQKCGVFKDWQSVHKIMKLLLSHTSIQPDLISFNIFVNNMALSDSPITCIQYLEIMIKQYAIKPDVITFASVIKSLRRQNKWKEAAKCWTLMTDKYDLKPHNILYCEMISVYSRAGQMDDANKILNEYTERVHNNEMELDVVIFNAYLNGFSRVGDMKGIQSVLTLLDEYGLECTENTITDVMRGCVKAKQYMQCMTVLKQWMDVKGKTPNPNMMKLKCLCFVQMIREHKGSFDEKYKLYLRLRDTIHNELMLYGMEVNADIARTELSGAIFLYAADATEVVDVFETLLKKGYIGYQNYQRNGPMCIDLHLFTLSEAQFIVRYLFGFKLNQIMDETRDCTLGIIVGKGKHSHGQSTNNANLRTFIMDELLSWNPPIRCQIDSQNKGKLVVPKVELIPYLTKSMKFTMIA
eukprot:110837_1